MITPPRTIERLLEALGAEPRFRDSVLGDLAEEYAARVENDGELGARRWYRREALRAAPHLFKNWVRRLRGHDVVHLVGEIVVSYFLLLSIGMVIAAIGYGALVLLGLPTSFHLPWENAALARLLFVSSLALGLVVTTVAGYVAAWVASGPPLANSVALAGVWSVAEAIGMFFPHGFPIWYRCSVPLVILIGCVLGGTSRVLHAAKKQLNKAMAV